jgi:Tol biopolymer transport system component
MVQPATADYIIDMVTGETTLLPAAIRNLAPSQYAASPDGSMLAFVAPDGDGSFQLFTAGIDGTDIRQITHPPLEASGPAWSPDGSLVAYVQSGGLFVLDVATGDSGRIPDVDANGLSTQFTPEGSSILYGNDGVWIVPIDGGSSTQLIGRDNGVETGGGSMSPDGSLVTFNGNRINGPGAIRFLADADGSNVRELGQLDGGNCGWSGASGIWSPDGARTVCAGNDEVRVVYVATGEDSVVAKGKAAIWLDDHTLLVEAWGG